MTYLLFPADAWRGLGGGCIIIAVVFQILKCMDSLWGLSKVHTAATYPYPPHHHILIQ